MDFFSLRMKKNDRKDAALSHRSAPVRVRFNETDSMGVVWHGNYAKFIEAGREDFGTAYGLDYDNVLGHGFYIPIVEMNIKYKHSLTYDDSYVVETSYIPCAAAKILFEYKIFRASDMLLVAEGSTVQVFQHRGGELELCNPDFYIEWQKRWGILP